MHLHTNTCTHMHAQTTPQVRWKLYSSLSDWKFLVVLGSQVYDSGASARHASACADMLLEAVEVLSSDENGELLLQPLGYCPELVQGVCKYICIDVYVYICVYVCMFV